MYAVYQASGGVITLPRTSAEQGSSSTISKFGGTVITSLSSLQPGDLVFFNTGGSTAISHVGVYAGVVDGQQMMWDSNISFPGYYPTPGVAERSISFETSGSAPLSFVEGVRYWSSNSGASSNFQVAFQSNGGSLYTFSSTEGTTDDQQGMAPGTSPSIAELSSGGYEEAFQSNTGSLYVYGSDGSYDTQQGMMAGTSPSIAASPNGGFEVAFQSNGGTLYTFSSSGATTNDQQGMMAGTSPSIAGLSSGGYEEAFQSNGGELYVYGSAGGYNTQQGMAPGTGPSIATSPNGGFEVAFQSNGGSLYTFSSSGGTTNDQQGMMAGTSPSIAGLSSGGYEEAFQSNGGELYVYGSAGGYNTQQGMAPGTSPTIGGLANNGYEEAFQANTGTLYVYGTGESLNTEQGMMTDTSPGIDGGGSAPSGEPPTITSSAGATFTVGIPGSFSVTTAGSPVPSVSESGALPAGLALSPAGLLTGTPAPGAAGAYPITIIASNNVASPATQSFTLTVWQAPAITTAPNVTFIKGASGTFKPTATGYPTPTISEDGTLPTGITYTSSAGISGTATESGTYPITITASNGVAPDATQNFTLTILPMGITTTSLPSGSVYSKSNKVTYSATLAASGGNPPYKWSLISGSALPPGLKLSSKGVISGRATTAGSFGFTVKVVDTKTKAKPSTQNAATATLSITIG